MRQKLPIILFLAILSVLMATLLYVAIPRENTSVAILQLLLAAGFAILISLLGMLPARLVDSSKKKTNRTS